MANDGIQNLMIRNHFCEIFQNLHFADNRNENKTDKNSKSSEVPSNDSEQNIDEHKVKFKHRSGMKEYIKSTPIKWDFKFWFFCSSNTGYLYLIQIYLGRKQTPEFNLGLGEELVLQLTKGLE